MNGCTRHDEVVDVKVGDNYPENLPPRTLVEVFRETVSRHPRHDAMKVKRNDEWQTTSYAEYHDQVQRFARALIAVGHQPRECVSIIGFNSPEWFIADVGAIYANGIAAGIYTTNGEEACHYVIDHSESVVVVAENQKQLDKILAVKSRLPKVKAIVVYDPEWTGKDDGIVYRWDSFMALGTDNLQDELESRAASIKPGNCSMLIYTSGTTGNPKAVMISHDNIVWTSETAASWIGTMKEAEEHIISYLPLSHIAANMIDICMPICQAGTVWFARPDALKGTLGQTLKEVRPTLFLAVPRVWEKIAEKMQAMGAQSGFVKKQIGSFCKSVGYANYYNEQHGLGAPWGYWLANTLAFNKVKQALGLDRCRHAATAAAPIHKETLEYFGSLNIHIYEIFGQSECTGPETISIKAKNRTGSCGPAMHGTELVLMNPDDEGHGEICYRGRHIFMGYLKNPEATNSTIDKEGFLHSGDIGKIDEDGFLYITGRIKELIITAGGENIPPVLIEDQIKLAVPYISNVMVIGDKRKFLSCVITLHVEMTPDGDATDKLTGPTLAKLKELGSSATTVSEAAQDADLRKAIEDGIKEANKHATSRAQNVQKFEILPTEFTVSGGELTETQKLKRSVAAKKYSDIIESMYA